MKDHEHSSQCSYWRGIGVFLWFASLITLIFAWIATANETFWGLESSHWYADALVLGILAIPLKLKHGHGRDCECKECR